MKFAKILFLFIFCSVVNAQQFRTVDSVIYSAIRNHVFPGAALLIGNADGVIYKKAFGHYTYDINSPLITNESLFDLASCTKVFATTSCVMKLVDEGRIKLDEPVKNYLPEFGANGKENVTVRNLLLHNSGMRAYYSPKKGESPADIWKAISGLPLAYKTDSAMVYSCLNFVTLMKVTETVTGMPMYKYFQKSIAGPLGLSRTMFNPPAEMKSACVPTADSLQGVVHDPLARGLLGLSGNAGLFSTTGDLAAICQLYFNGGKAGSKRIFSESAVETFPKRFSSLSSRALGWDTKSDSGFSSAGRLFSKNSFGHTGYTGTCAWFDPERRIFVILLTNRVFPDDKANISPVRARVNEAVIMELEKLTYSK